MYNIFDAVGSHRVYKEACSDEKIFELFWNEKGKQFYTKLVDILL